MAKPTIKSVREDVRKIISLLAAGFSPFEIRNHLGLSQRQLDYRMDVLRNKAADSRDVWPKYHAKAEQRMRHLEQIRQAAMDQDKLDVARRAVENMVRLDKEIVDVGQSLGAYKTAPKRVDVEISAPTLGMFHDAVKDAIDVTPEAKRVEHDG